MIVALNLPQSLAALVSLEAGRRGVSPARYIEDRLSDAFGVRPPAPAASRVALLPPGDDPENPDDE